MQTLRFLLSVLFLLAVACSSHEGGESPSGRELGASRAAVRAPVTYQVAYNTSATLALETGDTIRLTGFPTGWAYSSVEANFDGTTAPMDLTVTADGNSYTLSGWNRKIVFPYRGGTTQDVRVTSGSGSALLTWWVSGASPTPSDPPRPTDPPSSGPQIQDLGGMNATVVSESSSGIFRISSFPSWTYNVVAVTIEPRDGVALAGALSAGGTKVELAGWWQKVLFKERGNTPVHFDLAFPSPRKVALTWFVENRTPASMAIARTLTSQGANVTAKYGFAQDHAVQNDLSLSFAKDSFTDAAPPTFERLEHNPAGVRYPDRPEDLNGPTYNINGHLKPGKRVQVALPIPEIAVTRGIDEAALSIMHYSETSKTWTEILPDKVLDGYVYFTTDSFSSFFSRMARRAKKAAAAVVSAVSGAGSFVADTIVSVADGLKDGIKEAYKALVNISCALLDFDTYKKMLFDKPNFRAPPANLSDIARSPDLNLIELAIVDQKDLLELAGSDELDHWNKSKANAELLLADVILTAKGTHAARRFQVTGNFAAGYVISDTRHPGVVYPTAKVFRFTSTLLASAPRILQALQECDGALGLADEFTHTIGHVKDFIKQGTKLDLGGACRELLMLPADLVDWVVPDTLTCGIEMASLIQYQVKRDFFRYWGGGRDDHVLSSSAFLNVFSVLLWTDTAFRDAWSLQIDALRDELHSYVGFTHELYGDSNIMIKAMAGVSLWDMISKGDKGTYATLKRWLEKKSGDRGGYAEGTGYLQYVNEDVPYLMAAMVRGGFIGRDELPPKYLKSGEWLLNLSRVAGTGVDTFEFRPIEVDDALTHPADFFVYAFLTGDGRYQVNMGPPVSQPMRALVPLGVTDQRFPVSAPIILPDVYFAEGVGMVRAQGESSTATLSVIAEAGDMRLLGAGHDQQDNGSITLTNSLHGEIIVDSGYNGFGKRNDNLYARFDNHNVVMTEDAADFHGERANGKITFGDAASFLANQPNVHNFDWADPSFGNGGSLVLGYLVGYPLPSTLTWGALMSGWAAFENTPAPVNVDGHAGGADAGLLGPLVTDLPLSASHGLEVKHTSTAGVTNRRFLLSFGGHVFIIDRPDAKRSLWSRLHWARPPSVPANPLVLPAQATQAFQIPAPATTLDRALDIEQHGSPPRTVVQRTQVAGSSLEPPAFVTALTVDANGPSTFAQIPCQGAACMRNVTPVGEDLVVVPRWGRQFVDNGSFFQGLVVTGQIIVAHRDTGNPTWTFRLIGDEDAALAGSSLQARTDHIRDVIYRLGPNRSFVAIFPDGSTRDLCLGTDGGGAAVLDDFTDHTFVRPAVAIGSFADLVVERQFARPIRSIKVTIVDGQSDDIGYVGNTLVTDAPPSCVGTGTVVAPVDVTSEVQVTGDTARLVLRAKENCCCSTGWGSQTPGGTRRDARFHWEVTFADGC